MQAISRGVLAAGLCAWLAGCDSSPRSGVGVPDGDAQVVDVHLSLLGDVCGVTSAEATVTAADMAPLGPLPLSVVGATIQGRLPGVPAGTARQVSVAARNAAGLVVYEGSAVVDVGAGQAAPAQLVLHRNPVNCPGHQTGAIDVTGTLDPSPAGTDGGVSADGGVSEDGGVLSGPGLAFSFTDATLTADGVLHFFDPGQRAIHRLDLAGRQLLPALVGTATPSAMAVTPEGTTAYLAYTGGRIDAFNTLDGGSSFFTAAPATVSSMVVAGDYLFTVDDSGAWDTQALFRRATGERVAAAEWRNTARSLVYSAEHGRVFFMFNSVSPTDVAMVAVDGGTLGAEVQSPYHGDYSLPDPLRLLPDGTGLVVGSGLIFNTQDLTYRSSIGLAFRDLAFLGDRLYLIDDPGASTQLRTLNARFDILATRSFPGSARRLFAYGGELVLVTDTPNGLQVRFVAP